MIKLGDIVEVTFFDHVQSPDVSDAMAFCVYGRLVAMNKQSLTVACWTHASKRKKCDHNTTTFTILRSCVKTAVTLVPKVG